MDKEVKSGLHLAALRRKEFPKKSGHRNKSNIYNTFRTNLVTL